MFGASNALVDASKRWQGDAGDHFEGDAGDHFESSGLADVSLAAPGALQEGAIVARMSAVEELAGLDILCSDKTGTLTLNELTVDKPNVVVVPEGMSTEEVRPLSRRLPG